MDVSPSDAELVRSIAGGDADALMQMYQRHGRAVFSLAVYVVRDYGTAEEITQDAFVALWQKAYQFDAARGRLESWLLQITRNLAIDRLRYQRRRVQAVGSIETMESHPALRYEPSGSDQTHELNTLLSILPEAQRQTIELAYYQGYTHEEIAALLGLPLGTVKSRILLGLRKLQLLLK
jgi:RNA polymerase sigma-70 factor (ECF subfamily)